MKKKSTVIKTFFVLFLSMTLFNCSSNNDTILDGIEYINKIEFDGVTYPISGGLIDLGGGHNEFSMALYPEGITIKDSNNNNVFNGGNWFLEIEPLLTENNTIEGTYKSGDNVSMYFINNLLFIDDVIQPGDIVHEVNQNGTLVINKLGNEYEFIYNAFDKNGVPFSVYYKGPFTQVN